MNMDKFNFIVEQLYNGARLDKWLAEMLPTHSRVQIKKSIKEGLVLNNQNLPVTSPNERVSAGQSYLIGFSEPLPDSPLKAKEIPLNVLFEDDDIIVIDKSAGLVCHKGAGTNDDTLVNGLLYHCKGQLSTVGSDAGRQGIVHRLDKDTSGAMLACKTNIAHIKMYKDFANHDVKREYYALCFGIPNPISGQIETNINRSIKNRQLMTNVIEGGKLAITNYETVEAFTGAKFKPLSLIRCKLETGRTHQIRVHMAHIGIPLVGDKSYTNIPRQLTQIENKEVKQKLSEVKRQMLHSKNIEFNHPITGTSMRFETNLPQDMQELINFLKSQK